MASMSKYNVEQEIRASIDLLEDIANAIRLKDDVKLKKLCGKAHDSAGSLERARAEMHIHWND